MSMLNLFGRDSNLQLDPFTRSALDTLTAIPPRDEQAATRGRAAFLAQATAMKPLVQTIVAKRNAFKSLRILIFIIGGFLFGGATAAFASQTSNPNDWLYPVKILTEDVRLSMASDARERLALLIEFSDRRMMEIDVANVDTVKSRLRDQVDEALRIADQFRETELQNTTRANLNRMREVAARTFVVTATPTSQTKHIASPMPIPSTTPILWSGSTSTPTPIPNIQPTRDVIRATITALPRPTFQPTPKLRETRDTIRATITALPRPTFQPTPNLRETRDTIRATITALPRPTFQPTPNLSETRDVIRATITAFPRPTQAATPDLSATEQAFRATTEALRNLKATAEAAERNARATLVALLTAQAPSSTPPPRFEPTSTPSPVVVIRETPRPRPTPAP
jgi:hypothetical protein